MYLESLWVQGFRVLEDKHLQELGPLVVVEGENGAGKTTLLDAIYFLASGRSFLGMTNGELVRDGSAYFVVGGEYKSYDSVTRVPLLHSVQALCTAEGHKEARIDGTIYRGFIHLIGGLRVMQFNFNSVFLVKGMPSVRRQFLNLLIASCDRRYLETLSSYNSVVSRKNVLLKQGTVGEGNRSLLDLFDEQIVRLSNSIYAQRRTALVAINGDMERLIGEGLFGRLAGIRISYETQDLGAETLRAARDREIVRHMCLAGCHLDDFVLTRNGRPLRETASLGEAKITSLLLTFAGAEYVRSMSGEYPVLLLDDLEGDIDAQNMTRVTRLLRCFEQTFVTSFDVERLGGNLSAVRIQL